MKQTPPNQQLCYFYLFYHQMFTSNISISSKLIDQFSHFIQKGNIADLNHFYDFYDQVILKISKSPPHIALAFTQSLQNLVKIIKKKLTFIPQIQQLYPQMNQLLKQIQQNFDLPQSSPGKGEKISYRQKMCGEDKYFVRFINDQRIKQKQPSNNSLYQDFSSKQKLEMSNIIISKHYQEENWQFLTYKIINKYQIIKNPEYLSKKVKFYGSINLDRRMNNLCIGCCQLFYEGMNVRQANLTVSDMIVVCEIQEIGNYQELFKKSICALINSGGGIILFDCQQKYLKISPKGSLITQRKKQIIQQQITQMIKCFQPKITFDRNIKLSFVPIVENPLISNQINKDRLQHSNGLNFIRGKYVTRLKVWKDQKQKLTFYSYQHFKNISYIRDNGKTIQLKGRMLTKLIKRNFMEYYCPENVSDIRRSILTKSPNYLTSHICPQPLLGVLQREQIKQIPTNSTEYELEMQYKHTSIVFLYAQTPKSIKTYLKKYIFSKFRLKTFQPPTSDNMCIFFHDVNPQEVKRLFELYETQLSKPIKKRPLHLFLENVIQIPKSIDYNLLNHIVQDLYKRNANQQIKYYQNDKNKEYYLFAQYKVSLFYIFVKLREMKFNNIQIVSKNKLEGNKNIITPKYHFNKID